MNPVILAAMKEALFILEHNPSRYSWRKKNIPKDGDRADILGLIGFYLHMKSGLSVDYVVDLIGLKPKYIPGMESVVTARKVLKAYIKEYSNAA